MFDFNIATEIDLPPQRVWDFLIDVRRWWLESNPDHESLEILSPDDEIALGTELKFRELIAGIPGEVTGKITEFAAGECVTWTGRASYRLLGKQLTIEEGVTWSLRELERGTELSVHVWARFPDTWLAKAFEWLFVNVLRGIDRDREHAERELNYIRSELNKQARVCPAH